MYYQQKLLILKKSLGLFFQKNFDQHFGRSISEIMAKQILIQKASSGSEVESPVVLSA